ncbi:hypothetical protein JTB14_025753 [Gonioctena quinquepunctata]|nr:hypothetical protein JTB14_025753 [Gonioctena quinquepunctata]
MIISVIELSDGLNILVIMPHSGRSHQLVFDPMFEQLVKNGHNLTVITAFPRKNAIPNWRDISISDGTQQNTEILDFDFFTGSKLDMYMCHFLVAGMAEEACKRGLPHKNFQAFLKEDNHFDLILAELFNTNCFLGLAKKFNVPIVGMISSTVMPWTVSSFGSPDNPAFIPNHFLGNSDRMTFLGRLENTVIYLWNRLTYKYQMLVPGNEYSKKYLGLDVLDETDIMKNISILLMNAHFSLNLPKPLVPNIIEVGGLHLGEPKRLPEDLERFINESTDGVVYMSLGSTLKSHTLHKELKEAFLKAFSRLKQRVILKWETDIEEKPKNVMIMRWAPQFDILCHPNVKAFISHGGMGGITEAVYCGVPIMVMPQFGDQFSNAAALEASGGGLTFKLREATEERVLETLKNVLSPAMRQSMSDLSERFKDRPLSPMDTAIYWIEYVARHKGAPHMRTAAADMPIYQYLLLDVIAFLFFVIFSAVYMLYKIIYFIVGKIFIKQSKMKTN